MRNTPIFAGPMSAATSAPERKMHALPHITVSFYEYGIPAELENEIDELYESLFSSSAMFRATGAKAGLCAYAVREAGRASAIFVFRREGEKIIVLNEQISLKTEEINQFSSTIFSRWKSVRKIVFKAIRIEPGKIAFPHQQVNFSNDIVLSLPDSIEKYMASLGKSTRENIRRALKIARRDFPSFRFDIYEKEQATEKFHQIVNFNRARMAEKNKVCGINEKEEDKLLALVESCGVVGAVSVEGKVCGGVICYQVGRNYFVRVVAHDPQYNAYSLGLLSCYLSICECIGRGGREYHFLWGQEEYKFRLLGRRRDFDLLTVYRSPFSFIRDIAAISKSACSATLRKLKAFVLDPANRDKAVPRLAHRGMQLLRASRGGKKSA